MMLFSPLQGNALRKTLLTHYFGNQRLHSKALDYGSSGGSSPGGTKSSSNTHKGTHRSDTSIGWMSLVLYSNLVAVNTNYFTLLHSAAAADPNVRAVESPAEPNSQWRVHRLVKYSAV